LSDFSAARQKAASAAFFVSAESLKIGAKSDTVRAPRPYVPEAMDPTAVSPSGPLRAWKQFGLVLLCAAWVLLGLVGHDPWKSEDAVTFAIANEMAQRGDVVVPRLSGEPRLDRGPLVPALAAMTQKLFSPPLAPHNGARLAIGLVLALMLTFSALASRELNGRAFRWVPLLVLVGSVGFWDRSHALSADLGVTLAVAIALYGFALALRRPVVGGVVLGAGIGVGFLSHGLSAPLWIVMTAAILPFMGPAWRTRAWALTVGVAGAVALPLCGAWLAALQARDPALLDAWRATEPLVKYFAPVGSLDDFDPIYVLKNLLWFAWPALPLVLWTLWIRGRDFNGGLRQPGIEIPGVMALVMLATMALGANPSLTGMLPLLVPLALLASLEVDSLKRGFSGALDWFGILTFGLLAVVFWGLWIDAYVNGMSLRVARLFRDTEIGFQPTFKLWAILTALFLTALWIVLVRPARKSNRRALLNWAAGVVLLWGLYSTIWLPYLDSRRSYRTVAVALQTQVPPGCVAGRNIADAQRALFHYFGNIATVLDGTPAAERCGALLVQYGRQTPEPLPGWKVAWEGSRRGDDTERFVLYMKDKP